MSLRVQNSVSMLDRAFPLKPFAGLAFGTWLSQQLTKKVILMEPKGKNTPEKQIEILALIHKSLANGIRSAKAHTPRNWLKERGLTIESCLACFNSGQIHHRKPQQFKDALASVGFMKPSIVGTNAGQKPYTVFGIFSIMFPLRNVKNEIVNFYSVRIRSGNTAYMNQEPGLYPGYPNEITKKLYVTNSILDAATLLESKVLDNREAVMALHDGKVGVEHEEAIKRLPTLEEIIYIDLPLLKPAQEKKVWDRTKK